MRVALAGLVAAGVVGLASLVVLVAGVRRRRPPLVAGAVVALGALIVLFPGSCQSTAIGIPPGGPDPNDATCSTALFDALDSSVEGGHPSTHEGFTSVDLLRRRMATRALVAAVIPLFTALAGARLLRGRSGNKVAESHAASRL